MEMFAISAAWLDVGAAAAAALEKVHFSLRSFRKNFASFIMKTKSLGA